ncbi:hypothetical protein PP175_28345 (plasmid) [Aneurinibacillus sp. Ricciae_BoGa-3]|uniref:hypothetical protein n=1 Tax=Aneurinibacillus sp. Ricciae_BoGa-3 TaxID=3022697 RepID=UPI002340B82F|nr:hypothetical protein [Aneurinibacillus sp. Ricciae_BoGa-3]WCK57102.1 hypothetical protein PP175_28345 [Aneurinibacillus sp. Ricciae_BoGa-3]
MVEIKITGTTKKQVRKLISPLIKDIEQLKEDLGKVSHPSAKSAIQEVIESKQELLQAYKNYVGEWQSLNE